jgi:hypothetical protein
MKPDNNVAPRWMVSVAKNFMMWRSAYGTNCLSPNTPAREHRRPRGGSQGCQRLAESVVSVRERGRELRRAILAAGGAHETAVGSSVRDGPDYRQERFESFMNLARPCHRSRLEEYSTCHPLPLALTSFYAPQLGQGLFFGQRYDSRCLSAAGFELLT